MKTDFLLKPLFLCLLIVVFSACDEEEFFNLSSLKCDVNGKPYTYKDDVLGAVIGMQTGAKYIIDGDNASFLFSVFCNPDDGSSQSCMLTMSVNNEGELKTKTKYRFTTDNKEEVTQSSTAKKLNINSLFIRHQYRIELAPENEDGTNQSPVEYFSAGLAGGYVEFSKFDRKKNWVHGKFEAFLNDMEHDAEGVYVKGDFKFSTEFLVDEE